MALRVGFELISRPANSEKILDVGVVVVLVLVVEMADAVDRAGDVGKGG